MHCPQNIVNMHIEGNSVCTPKRKLLSYYIHRHLVWLHNGFPYSLHKIHTSHGRLFTNSNSMLLNSSTKNNCRKNKMFNASSLCSLIELCWDAWRTSVPCRSISEHSD